MNNLVIDGERCKECGYCMHFCPQKTVLEKSGRTNKRGYYYAVVSRASDCVACGICATVCPEIAIRVEKEA